MNNLLVFVNNEYVGNAESVTWSSTVTVVPEVGFSWDRKKSYSVQNKKVTGKITLATETLPLKEVTIPEPCELVLTAWSNGNQAACEFFDVVISENTDGFEFTAKATTGWKPL